MTREWNLCIYKIRVKMNSNSKWWLYSNIISTKVLSVTGAVCTCSIDKEAPPLGPCTNIILSHPTISCTRFCYDRGCNVTMHADGHRKYVWNYSMYILAWSKQTWSMEQAVPIHGIWMPDIVLHVAYGSPREGPSAGNIVIVYSKSISSLASLGSIGYNSTE